MKDVGLFRVSGLFPTISKDGSKLAYVGNDFKAVFVLDSQGPRIIYEQKDQNCVFSPVWNQNPDKDILYICVGLFFGTHKTLEIYSIHNASSNAILQRAKRLTDGGFNNAFPSSSPDGNKFVFRSTRDGLAPHMNLYIMLDGDSKESGKGWETRLTKGNWTDTHCQWSPNGDWIVFSSTREYSNQLDLRYFSMYLVKANDPTVLIRVVSSGGDLGRRINYPVFSPDGRSIAVIEDLTAVSVDPVSLPNFKRKVRKCGVILVVDIHLDSLKKRKYQDVKMFRFRRMTHSRYECGKAAWTTTLLPTDPHALWNMLPEREHMYAMGCPHY
jgi:Tol biopolymer transport system component